MLSVTILLVGYIFSLHTVGYRSSVPTINNPLQSSSYASMNPMYAGSSEISSVQLVGSAAASFNISHIPSTDCLTDESFSILSHDISLLST